MARKVITKIVIGSDVRVRVAGSDGDCMFLAGGKIYDNEKYDGKWHKFPEGTQFELAAIVDKTDTYLVLAKEKITTVSKDEEGNEKTSTKTEVNGVFLRRMSYEKLLSAASAPEVQEDSEVVEDDDFGKAIDEVPDSPEVEVDGPTDAELEELELDLAVG